MKGVVFAINITADGYSGHTDMIADEEELALKETDGIP